MKIKIHTNVTKQGSYFWFTIYAANHKVIATGETYETKQACIKTAAKFNLPIIDTTTK